MCKKYQFYAIVSMVVVYIAACSPPLSSPTAIPLTPTFIPAETLIANSDYMKGCAFGEVNPNREQADFLGIYAGQVSQDEIVQYLGVPKKISSFENSTAWIYDGFKFAFEFESLSYISAYADKYMFSLSEMLAKYGCPDVIFAVDIEANGNYYATSFVYYKTGVGFYFESLPVKMDAHTMWIRYFRVIPDFNVFMNEQGLIYSTPDLAKPIPWKEAVIEP